MQFLDTPEPEDMKSEMEVARLESNIIFTL